MWCQRNKPGQALFDAFQKIDIQPYERHVLTERYLNVLDDFHKRAWRLSMLFHCSRIIVTVGSILVPAFLSIEYIDRAQWTDGKKFQMNIYWVTWILSITVSVCNALTTLFKIDKKYYFIYTTLEILHSEGWQYISLSGRYSPKDPPAPPTHDNQFIVFFHTAEKIKMRQVEEEYWKLTDSSAQETNSQRSGIASPSPWAQQGQLSSLPSDKKAVIEGWLDELKQSRGLQPRGSPIDNGLANYFVPIVDKGGDGTPAHPEVPEYTEKFISRTPPVSSVSVSNRLPKSATGGETVVQGARVLGEEV